MQAVHYICPAVTPMNPDLTIDYDSLGSLYEHLIRGSVDGILLLGSIGEFFGFDQETKKELITEAVRIVDHRVPLYVGATSMVVEEIIDLSCHALQTGADAVVVIPPYYFHFDDSSVFSYYDMLADRIPGNMFLYNFPDRTGYEIAPRVVRDLALKHANIIGIKDTIGGLDHTREIIKAVKPLRPDFLVYSGFDDNFAHNVLCGGNGCIAGISNLYPKLTSAWVKAIASGDLQETQRIQQIIDRLMDIYRVGKPFIPFIKNALVQEGIIASAAATLPMPEVTQAQADRLQEIMGIL